MYRVKECYNALLKSPDMWFLYGISRGSSLTLYTQCDNYVKYNKPVVFDAIKSSNTIILLQFCAMLWIMW